jgi:hypothetical protein
MQHRELKQKYLFYKCSTVDLSEKNADLRDKWGIKLKWYLCNIYRIRKLRLVQAKPIFTEEKFEGNGCNDFMKKYYNNIYKIRTEGDDESLIRRSDLPISTKIKTKHANPLLC